MPVVMKLEDVYAATDAISGRLDTLGLGAWKTRLEDAVAAGATSGEILMAVRWHLKQLRSKEPGLPADLRAQIDSLIAAINKLGV